MLVYEDKKSIEEVKNWVMVRITNCILPLCQWSYFIYIQPVKTMYTEQIKIHKSHNTEQLSHWRWFMYKCYLFQSSLSCPYQEVKNCKQDKIMWEKLLTILINAVSILT